MELRTTPVELRTTTVELRSTTAIELLTTAIELRSTPVGLHIFLSNRNRLWIQFALGTRRNTEKTYFHDDSVSFNDVAFTFWR